MAGDNKRRWPDFLVIGAMRSGTSWLSEILGSHPGIYMPDKELNFFNKYYPDLIDWYRKQLAGPKTANPKVLTGEKTPSYLFNPNVPQRVYRCLDNGSQFIVILRDPVDRAISHFRHHCQYNGCNYSFEDIIEKKPKIVDYGRYALQIRRWLRYFPRDKFLFLTLERASKDFESLFSELAAFLDVDENGFKIHQAQQRVNPSYIPPFHKIYICGSRLNSFFRRRRIFRLSNFIVFCGKHFKYLKPKTREEITVKEETQRKLREFYKKDILELEEILGRELKEWTAKKAYY